MTWTKWLFSAGAVSRDDWMPLTGSTPGNCRGQVPPPEWDLQHVDLFLSVSSERSFSRTLEGLFLRGNLQGERELARHTALSVAIVLRATNDTHFLPLISMLDSSHHQQYLLVLVAYLEGRTRSSDFRYLSLWSHVVLRLRLLHLSIYCQN